ncbi:energy-coupling factor transporter transmembrane component T family protein [Campylobacter fetus]|uniref:energy-coupling factor transporter transmembrane component T family protein n=1 Tax=Campylobacter fetus TaxID=196 RepID=UPI00073A9DE3|nr:energy-coupling factor transporter transmembrane component T [Campylobacter fetus]ALV64166.1 Co/Ni ABC transporter CbiKLMQO, membrane protein CbiQ [Campylobacter fetus subsp. testudinum Sp3]
MQLNLSCGLVCLVIFSFKVALSSSIDATFFLPILFLLFIKFKNILSLIKKMIFLNLFIILVALSVMIYENYHLAALIFIRSNLIIFFGLSIFSTANSYDIAISVSNLKLGDKISAMFYFTVKFIDEFKSEFQRIKQTLKARGFKPCSSLFTYKTYGNLVAMLFLSAFHKSQMLEKTFICRGFQGKFYTQNRQKIGILDIILLIFTIFIYILSLGKII